MQEINKEYSLCKSEVESAMTVWYWKHKFMELQQEKEQLFESTKIHKKGG